MTEKLSFSCDNGFLRHKVKVGHAGVSTQSIIFSPIYLSEIDSTRKQVVLRLYRENSCQIRHLYIRIHADSFQHVLG